MGKLELSLKQARILYAVLSDALDGVWWNTYPTAHLRAVMDALTAEYGITDPLDWMLED